MIYIENKSVYKNHTCVICQKGHNANVSVCDFPRNKTHVFPKNKPICDLSALMSQTGSLRVLFPQEITNDILLQKVYFRLIFQYTKNWMFFSI